MARKTVTTIEEESPPETAPGEGIAYTFDEMDDKAVQAESALEGLLDEFSSTGDAIVNVYRQISGANNIAFLFKTTPTEMRGGEIMEKLRDEYGSGDYRVHVRADNRIVGNKGFSVEKPDAPEVTAPKDNTSDMMAMMMNQANNQQAIILAAISAFGNRAPPPPPPDPAAMQLAMVQTLATLKEIATPPAPPVADDGVERLIQGITLAQKLAGKEGETNSSDLLMEGIRQFAPVIAQATQGGMHQGAPGMPPGAPGVPGAPQIAPPAPGAPPPPQDQEMFEKTLLKTQLKFLVKNAQEGRNPELYAELLLDQVGELKLLEFIGEENAMEKLIALVPEVESVRPWFERMRVTILELTAPENADHNEGETGEYIPGTPMGSVIIPAAPDAVSDTPNDGDSGGTPAGGNGDTPHP